MTGAVDLAESERGVFCIAISLIATVLVVLRILTGGEWIDLIKWVVTTLLVTKTVSGVAALRTPAAAPATSPTEESP